ncbi:MAG: hypothetical protein MUD01_19665 [Chloroflexaceae bacterium]|nr:hypothetical protein [Chloroflexaceae bacterium]
MNCFFTTGTPCMLHRPRQSDLFEIHVTVDIQQQTELQTFLSLCQYHKWKAIIIDLIPASARQPMTCSRITGTIDDVYTHAQYVQTQLSSAGLSTSRIKIEAAPWNSHVPKTNLERDHYAASAYFEYHVKLHLPTKGWQDSLPRLCQVFGAHVSRNALRQEADGTSQRFVTIRSHTAGLDFFQRHTDLFQQALHSEGFVVLAAVTEFCIFDSNIALDALWYHDTIKGAN